MDRFKLDIPDEQAAQLFRKVEDLLRFARLKKDLTGEEGKLLYTRALYTAYNILEELDLYVEQKSEEYTYLHLMCAYIAQLCGRTDFYQKHFNLAITLKSNQARRRLLEIEFSVIEILKDLIFQ